MPFVEIDTQAEDRGFGQSLVRTLVLPAISLLVGGVAHTVTKAPEGMLARALSPGLVVLAILFAARFVAHVELKYWQWAPGLHRVMCCMMVAEGVIVLVFALAGPCLFFEVGNPSPHSLSVEEFYVAIALLVAILLQTLTVSWLAEELGLERGTENARYCLAVRVLKDAALRLSLRGLVKRLERTTAANSLSVLVLWILISLSSVAFANSPSVGPSLYRIFVPHKPSEEGDRSVGPSSHGGYISGCGRRYDPNDFGAAVPKGPRSKLFAQWFGQERGLGEIFGGCINHAHKVGSGNVWVAVGSCDGIFRSLAIATPAGADAILLWGPGRFALHEAEVGSLVEATPHVLIGSGDMYTVTTNAGTNAFVRKELSDRSGGLKGAPHACSQIKEDPVPYTRIPPALTRLWLSQMEQEERWLWPTLEVGQQSDRRFEFHSLDPKDRGRITAVCGNETSCSIVVAGVQSRVSRTGSVSVEKLMSFAPAPL